ncbi:MAG: tyrosine-type recombinase/integrase [Thermoleophilia bacterium]
MVDAHGFRLLAAGFLASRVAAGTRQAYRRDLVHLAVALGVPDAIPDDREVTEVFGVEEDPSARAAATQMAGIPEDWWRTWRDGLTGSVATRRRRVAAVRAFCRWWSRVLDGENPVRDLRPPGGAPTRGRPGRDVVALAPAATRRLCEAAARPGPVGARDAALVELLYGCGLRASEASGMDISACHLDDEDDPYVVVTGKGSRTRAVAVPASARTALLAYLRVARPQLRAGARTPVRADADAVFLSVRGRRLGREDIWRVVGRAASRAGLTDDGGRVFPHALRHSCGTHLIQSGVDIRYVQAHLGHASPVTTEIYTHVTAAHLAADFHRAHPRARAG